VACTPSAVLALVTSAGTSSLSLTGWPAAQSQGRFRGRHRALGVVDVVGMLLDLMLRDDPPVVERQLPSGGETDRAHGDRPRGQGSVERLAWHQGS
jgi:hypothetical protein